MGKASNFVSTDATKRRKQIASVANKFVLLVFFLGGSFFFLLTVDKRKIYNFLGLEEKKSIFNEVLYGIFRELLWERNIEISGFDCLKFQICSNFFRSGNLRKSLKYWEKHHYSLFWAFSFELVSNHQIFVTFDDENHRIFFWKLRIGKKVKILKFLSSFPIAILKYSQLRLICNRIYRIFVKSYVIWHPI